jgi:signal transduction histidine kinase
MMQRETAVIDGDRVRLGDVYGHRQKEKHVFVLLICGFGLIALLLGIDAWVGYHGAASVRTGVAVLTENQLVSVPLINEIQRSLSELSSIQYRLASADTVERAHLKSEIRSVETSLNAVFSRVPGADPDIEMWHEIRESSSLATSEIERLLDLPTGTRPDMAKLTAHLERLSAATGKLVQTSLARADTSRRRIDSATQRQSVEDLLTLMACLIVASLFLWTAVGIYHRMSEQSKELSNVSWQLLEKQESLARRLSRDLHDELGQTLTALKTNFSRHSSASCVDPAWIQDCTDLLKSSIRDAHEISQLLRPTLLDDFGLEPALAWLCEKFEERNKIQVSYASDIAARLEEQTETHIFRIAQEALTNIARHANASHVRVIFARDDNGARLEISDNGVGLPSAKLANHSSFGLTGMKARARSLRGEMHIESVQGRGTTIVVTFPLQESINEKHPHFVS